MSKEAKILITSRLPKPTLAKIEEYIKYNALMNQADVLERAIDRLMESDSNKKLRKLYKVAKKATFALYAKKDFEGLSGQDGNILDCLHNLTEYIENLETETDELDQ